MEKIEIINSNIPICPDCNGKMTINLPRESIRCIECGTLLHIIGLGQTERDFVTERRQA